jgi:RNA polymerase sigma-70 factor (ECF subfamily)
MSQNLENSLPANAPSGNKQSEMNSPGVATTAVPAGRLEIDWGRAFTEHYRWLKTVVRNRLGEQEPVEDVLQEVGLAASKRGIRPDDPDKVAPWLYRVALRQCLFYRRTRGRRRKLEDRVQVAGAIPATTPRQDNPAEWILTVERSTAVRDALAELPELDRELMLLKYTENWTYQELARHLGVSAHTIEHRLLKAKRALRQRLLNRDITHA